MGNHFLNTPTTCGPGYDDPNINSIESIGNLRPGVKCFGTETASINIKKVSSQKDGVGLLEKW